MLYICFRSVFFFSFRRIKGRDLISSCCVLFFVVVAVNDVVVVVVVVAAAADADVVVRSTL